MNKEVPSTLFEQALAALKSDDDKFVTDALFPFEIEDCYYVEKVTEAVHKLLERPNLTEEQVTAVKRALLGLGRMPLRTPGLNLHIRLGFRTKTEAQSYNLMLTDQNFTTDSGGYVDMGQGSDSFSGSTFMVEGNFRQCDAWSSALESWPDVFQEMTAAKLEIEWDDSDETLLDWDHPDGSIFWKWIENHG